jgi:hypothetical protein
MMEGPAVAEQATRARMDGIELAWISHRGSGKKPPSLA